MCDVLSTGIRPKVTVSIIGHPPHFLHAPEVIITRSILVATALSRIYTGSEVASDLISVCQRSSTVELWFCKPVVVGSNPTVGCQNPLFTPARTGRLSVTLHRDNSCPPCLFTARRLDILNGGSLKLQYSRFRYYDPETGRWLTHDPLGYVDGMNLYEYVRSMPVSTIDPTGLTPIITSWETAQFVRGTNPGEVDIERSWGSDMVPWPVNERYYAGKRASISHAPGGTMLGLERSVGGHVYTVSQEMARWWLEGNRYAGGMLNKVRPHAESDW